MFNFPYLHLNSSIKNNHCVVNRSLFNVWLVTQPTQRTYIENMPNNMKRQQHIKRDIQTIYLPNLCKWKQINAENAGRLFNLILLVFVNAIWLQCTPTKYKIIKML